MNSSTYILQIGILKYEPGWDILFQQIGVSWIIADGLDENASRNFSILIINRPVNSFEFESISKFLSDGGSVITVGMQGQEFIGAKYKKQYISSVSPLQFVETTCNDILDIFSNCFIATEKFVSIDKSTGIVVHIPFDVNHLLLRNSSQRKNFYANKNRLPNEIVSTTSKNTICEIVASLFEYLYHRRNLPFIHKWYFPKNEQTLFTFRIDSDKGSKEEIEELYSLSKKYEIPTTWFLDVKSHEEWIDDFPQFEKQEIGIHCYEHETYPDVETNVLNISKAIALLDRHNISWNGISAPRGNWSTIISSAYEQLKMGYSSEFSYDYDNLPSYPFVDNHFSTVLQLPIHPICAGSLRRSGYNEEEMFEYFISIIDKKISLRKPICLYHHPTHHFTEVFDKVFQYIQEKQIHTYSYSEYALWWMKRNNAKFFFTFNEATKTISATIDNSDIDVWYRISMLKNVETITHVQTGSTQLSNFNFSDRIIRYEIPDDIMRIRKFDWRHTLISALEFYYKIKK